MEALRGVIIFIATFLISYLANIATGGLVFILSSPVMLISAGIYTFNVLRLYDKDKKKAKEILVELILSLIAIFAGFIVAYLTTPKSDFIAINIINAELGLDNSSINGNQTDNQQSNH